jgi:hypothetical protein
VALGFGQPAAAAEGQREQQYRVLLDLKASRC